MKTWYVLMDGDSKEFKDGRFVERSCKQRVTAERYAHSLTTNVYYFYIGEEVVAEFPYGKVKSIVPDTKEPNTPNNPHDMEFK